MLDFEHLNFENWYLFAIGNFKFGAFENNNCLNNITHLQKFNSPKYPNPPFKGGLCLILYT